MRKTAVFLLLAVCAVTAPGSHAQQWTSIGDAARVLRITGGVEIKASHATIRVTAVSDSVIRVRAAQHGTLAADASWAVIEQPRGTAPRISETSSKVEIAIPAGRVRIMKSPLRLVFLDEKGQVINEDDDRLPMSFAGTAFRVTKKMPEDEIYSGLGDKTSLNLRN